MNTLDIASMEIEIERLKLEKAELLAAIQAAIDLMETARGKVNVEI